MEISMIDATSGGALVDKTPQEARVFILNIAVNFQQFNTRVELPVRKVNEVSTSTSLEQQIANLTSVVQQLAMGGTAQVMRCGIYSKNDHLTDLCPTFYEEGSNEQVNVVGGFQGQNGFPRKYDPFSNTYNPGWRDHPNFGYGGNQQAVGPNASVNHPPGFFQLRQQQTYQPQQNSRPSLDEIVKTLALRTL